MIADCHNQVIMRHVVVVHTMHRVYMFVYLFDVFVCMSCFFVFCHNLQLGHGHGLMSSSLPCFLGNSSSLGPLIFFFASFSNILVRGCKVQNASLRRCAFTEMDCSHQYFSFTEMDAHTCFFSLLNCRL